MKNWEEEAESGLVMSLEQGRDVEPKTERKKWKFEEGEQQFRLADRKFVRAEIKFGKADGKFVRKEANFGRADMKF